LTRLRHGDPQLVTLETMPNLSVTNRFSWLEIDWKGRRREVPIGQLWVFLCETKII